METWLDIPILAQPDDATCGPTCLQAVYAYYGLELPLPQVIAETRNLKDGGTLGVLLGIDALRRGFRARLITYNLFVFDPTWFLPDAPPLTERLHLRKAASKDDRLRVAVDAYLEFIELGGEIRFEDLTPTLLRRYLKKEAPILTGLSATYLYRSAREVYANGKLSYDDVNGEPQGHFVVLRGYDPGDKLVSVADPLHPNPLGPAGAYRVGIHRLLCAILLGIVTYDANLLIIRHKKDAARAPHAHHPGRRQA